MSVTEPRWLDRLARSAARRERGYAPVRSVDGGMSRRTVVRATGAAVAVGTVARFLARPPVARADALSDCITKAHKDDDYLYDQCAKGPTAAYQSADAAITAASAALKTAKSKGRKARLGRIIQENQSARRKAVNDLMDCGFQYAHNRARDEDFCRQSNPPGGGSGGGGGGGGAGGGGGSGSTCPEGTHPCTKIDNVTMCCYGSDTCCACNGGLCCIYPDCRCCPS